MFSNSRVTNALRRYFHHAHVVFLDDRFQNKYERTVRFLTCARRIRFVVCKKKHIFISLNTLGDKSHEIKLLCSLILFKLRASFIIYVYKFDITLGFSY